MKILIALSILLAAILFAAPADQYGRRRLGLNATTISGLEFILLGIPFSQIGLNVFTETVIFQLFPIISFSLGWLGFLVTIDFEFRILKKVGTQPIALALIFAVVTFVVVGLGFWLVNRTWPIFSAPGIPWILAAVSVSTSPLLLRHLAGKIRVRATHLETILFLTAFGGIVGIFAYGVVADFLKATPWWRNLLLDLALGLGTGLFLNLLVSSRRTHNEMLLFVYGSIFLSSGLAGLLGLSPLFVNAIAGTFVANASVRRYRVAAILSEGERLILVLILVTFGALWAIPSPEWRGFLLTAGLVGVAYFLLRLGGRWLAAFSIGKLAKTKATSLGFALLCQTSIAVALLIDFRLSFPSAADVHLLFVGMTLAWFLAVWPAYRFMEHYLRGQIS